MIRICFFLTIISFSFGQNTKIELFNESIKYFKLNDHKNVILNLNKFIELDSTQSEIFYRRGYSKLMIKDYQSSVQDFNKALLLLPKDPKSLFNKAFALHEIAKNDEAIECLNQLIELEPNEFEAYSKRGEIYYDLKLYDKALSDFLIVNKINSELDFAINLLGLTYYKKK